MSTKQIPFSCSTDTDMDVIKHLDKMPKGIRSNYIRELIRADMNRHTLEDVIRKIVQDELRRGNGGDGVVDAIKNMFE